MTDWFKDPGTTPMLDRLSAISGIIGPRPEPVKMWVTSTVWAAIALETGHAPGEHGKPEVGDFSALKFGKNLLVINAGTDDEEFCHTMNRPGAEASGFAWKKDAWRVG